MSTTPSPLGTGGGSDRGHGTQASPEDFSNLLGLRPAPGYNPQSLKALADRMVSDADAISDGPDPEENLFVPAGYTYFGQFVDHDLTLDTTSTLDAGRDRRTGVNPSEPSNFRTPRLDLDCVYGNGPDDQPYLYVQADSADPAARDAVFKGASLFTAGHDLPRGPNGRALIGDKRNDENSIVNQIQHTFIRFHNAVVRKLVRDGERARGTALFHLTRDQVRWAYQTLVVQDYLPRIIEAVTLDKFINDRGLKPDGVTGYRLYTFDKRYNLPREFVVAAYRFGHSLVRTGYRLNGVPGEQAAAGTRLPIFTPSDQGELSLVGFDPLPTSHVIDDWRRFFPPADDIPGSRPDANAGRTFEAPNEYDASVRLQWAYKIDPSLSDPLGQLPPKIADRADVPAAQRPAGQPSLALLNLLRGNGYRIQSGQAFEARVGAMPLDPKYLVTRVKHEQEQPDGETSVTYSFRSIIDIDPAFETDTPLWFYVLAEAQRPLVDLAADLEKAGDGLSKDDMLGVRPGSKDQRAVGTQLGPVGGRIVAEVFYGLLDSDPDSIFGRGLGRPLIWGGSGPHSVGRLLDFLAADQA